MLFELDKAYTCMCVCVRVQVCVLVWGGCVCMCVFTLNQHANGYQQIHERNASFIVESVHIIHVVFGDVANTLTLNCPTFLILLSHSATCGLPIHKYNRQDQSRLYNEYNQTLCVCANTLTVPLDECRSINS